MDNDMSITAITSFPSVLTNTGTVTVGAIGSTSYGTLTVPPTATEDLMERYELNRVTVEHKVASHELLKLKEVAPTYADEIKENLSKNATRDIVKKMSFTKKHDKDADVHYFIGRVWVFTEDELKKLIEEAKHA